MYCEISKKRKLLNILCWSSFLGGNSPLTFYREWLERGCFLFNALKQRWIPADLIITSKPWRWHGAVEGKPCRSDMINRDITASQRRWKGRMVGGQRLGMECRERSSHCSFMVWNTLVYISLTSPQRHVVCEPCAFHLHHATVSGSDSRSVAPR